MEGGGIFSVILFCLNFCLNIIRKEKFGYETLFKVIFTI